MWAVVYENGMSLTIASEQTAYSLAQAERDRGRVVTVQRLDDDVTHPAEPIDEPEPTSEPESASAPEPAQAVEPVQARRPVQAAEPASVPDLASEAAPPVPAHEPAHKPTHEPEPARPPMPARRRRLPLYALAAAVIVVAAALADHWGVLPRLGADTRSSPTHVSRPHRSARLLPPLGQPPVMHFGSALVQPDRLYLPNAHGPRRPSVSVGRPSTIVWGGSH